MPGSTAEICEIYSLNDFASVYARLAEKLGRAGKTPPVGETEFLHSMMNRKIQHPGEIGVADYFFLTAFVSILAPQRVIEIGTLTGFSAAIIAATIGRQREKTDGIFVETLDVSTECIIDTTRPTGFEISDLIPELASAVRLHTPHGSDFVSQLGERGEFPLVFIDADHRHPWPLLDLLRLAPYVASGGWVLLHDIHLGTMGRKMRAEGQTTEWGTPDGAEWLFDRWPFRKISGGNIGAVELPADKAALIPFGLSLMETPFEITGKAAVRARRALYRSFAELT